MNNVGEKFLPLGTVVMLKGASKRLMITGFCTMAAEEEEGVMYDYAGCMYPEGFISSDQTALFNHDQIEKVYHLGLVDQEEKDFKIKLNQLLYANNVVAESAPQAIREEEGIAVVSPTTPVVEAPVPPVGPGLPGYVAPSAPQTVTSNGFEFDANGNVVAAPAAPAPAPVEAPVPPIGPGLPGYVAPAAPQTVTSNGFEFDANGNVVAAPAAPAPTEQPTPAASISNIQFDEDGTVVSA